MSSKKIFATLKGSIEKNRNSEGKIKHIILNYLQ
jgi:hypothetical protein